MQIILQPVSFQLTKDTISILEKVLSEEFNAHVSTVYQLEEKYHFNYLIETEINGNQMRYYNGFWINIDQTKQQQQQQKYWLYVILMHILMD